MQETWKFAYSVPTGLVGRFGAADARQAIMVACHPTRAAYWAAQAILDIVETKLSICPPLQLCVGHLPTVNPQA